LLDGLASLDVEMEREIMVKGWGQARSMPDRAVIDVLVETEAASREQAYGQAAGLTQQVDQVLANRASAVALARTAVLMVHPKSRWKRGESVRTGWRAVRGTSVEVTDFSQLGEFDRRGDRRRRGRVRSHVALGRVEPCAPGGTEDRGRGRPAQGGGLRGVRSA